MVLKKMKTFKAEKEILEEFFKNRANFIISKNWINMLNDEHHHDDYPYFNRANPLSIITTNMFTPNKYNLDFVKEKTKAHLLYVISMLESGEMYNVSKTTIWTVITIYFCDVCDDILTRRKHSTIVTIYKSLYEENDNFLHVLNRIIEHTKKKNSFTYKSPLKPFNIEFFVNFASPILIKNSINDEKNF